MPPAGIFPSRRPFEGGTKVRDRALKRAIENLSQTGQSWSCSFRKGACLRGGEHGHRGFCATIPDRGWRGGLVHVECSRPGARRLASKIGCASLRTLPVAGLGAMRSNPFPVLHCNNFLRSRGLLITLQFRQNVPHYPRNNQLHRSPSSQKRMDQRGAPRLCSCVGDCGSIFREEGA